MEKPNNSKHKNLFLKFLPKVSFQNPPFSPGRDHHHHSSTKLKAHAYKGFSGPINFAVLPDEAREKPKNGGRYDSQEPTSPKVSCMGQIKYKNKKKKIMKNLDHHHHHDHLHHDHDHDHDDDDDKESGKGKEEKRSGGSRMMSKFLNSMRSPNTNKKKNSKSSNGSEGREHGKLGKGAVQDNNNKIRKKGGGGGVPGLGQMRKFASGRDTLGNFDWTAQIAPVDHDRDCFSDDDRRRDHSDDDHDHDDDDEEERENMIPFSAPMMLGGGGNLNLEPRKEVNLWKRRTMDPPPPLALRSSGR